MKTLALPSRLGWMLSVLAAAYGAAAAQPQIKLAQPGIWPGFTRGDAQAVRVAGDYAYVGLSHGGLSGGLTVVDISDPSKPFPVGGIDFPGAALGLDVAGGYAYVAAHSGGLQVIDVRDPANPLLVGSYQAGGFAWDVQVIGKYAYAAITDVGLVVLDFSEPAHPVSAGIFAMAGWVKKLRVVDDVAYMTVGDRIEIVRVNNGTNLTHAGSYKMPQYDGVNDVEVVGRYAYLASVAGMEVVDVNNPAAPLLVSTSTTDGWASTALRVAGHYAYVAVDPVAMVVFDVSDPAHPEEVGQADTGEFPYDLEVAGGYAFVAADLFGLHVFDVADPASPVRTGGYAASGSAEDVQVSGDYAYLADSYAGLEVIDTSNPANPKWAGGYFTGGQVTGLQLQGQTVFLSDRGRGLLILDISTPTSPRLAGRTVNAGIVNGFQVAGAYAYLACNSGLMIVDVSSRTNPVVVGSCAPSDYFAGLTGVRVAGHFAYVAIDRDMYTDTGVIDVTDPAYPAFVGSLDSSGGAWITDIKEIGRYLLVADSTPLLKVYDNSDPTNLFLASTFRTPSWANTITLAGQYAYVSEGGAGVQVLDVSNPTNLIAVGRFDTHGPAANIYVAEKLVYVAEWGKGLVILPSAPLVQFTLQVDGVPGVPCTVEAARVFAVPPSWEPILTTNGSRMPFWFIDSDVKAGPKFYRVKQP